MSTYVNTEARRPAPVVAALTNGADLASKVGQAIAVDSAGRPHHAMLSVEEICSASATDIKLVPYAGSATTAALAGAGRALLHLVLDSISYRIRVGVRRIGRNPGPSFLLLGGIVSVDEDRVGYEELTSGISYRLADQDVVVERWCRQIDQLRAMK